MSELETLISVLGTLGGLLVGSWVTLQIESRRHRHEKETEYQKEIKQHMDDVIKPLFYRIEDLWGSLATLQVSLRQKASIFKNRTLDELK